MAFESASVVPSESLIFVKLTAESSAASPYLPGKKDSASLGWK